MEKKNLVIIGWGFAGLRTFYSLYKNKSFSITLIDKSAHYLMKPIYPEVAIEGVDVAKTKFAISEVIEGKGGKFINSAVTKIDGANNKIILESGEIEYDYLVVTSGATKDFQAVKGLEDHGYSVCDEDHAVKLWEKLQTFKWGKILIGSSKSTFDETSPGLKWEAPCEGPIWEGMYMIEHYLRKNGLKDKTQITAFAPWAVFRWDAPNLHESKWIGLLLDHAVAEVKEKSVVFENGEEVESDLTIVIPIYKWQQFLIDSDLADSKGFITTNENMQNEKYKNIFAAGDINTRAMPKLGHIANMQADIVSAMLKKEVWENVTIPEFKPEVFCVMNMGGSEASVFLSDKAFGWKNHMFWHNGLNSNFKKFFDWYMITFKGQVPPDFAIEIFKKLTIWVAKWEK